LAEGEDPVPGESEAFEAQWRRRFIRYAADHEDDAGIAGWSATGLAARVRFFARYWCPAAARGPWLDVGCGAGTYTRWLAERGESVVGVDYSLPSLEKAKRKGPREARWLVADAQALPFGAGSAGGVLCLGVTQALSDTGTLVAELERVLAEGGTLWLDGLNGWCLPHLAERLRARLGGPPTRLRYESPFRLRRAVARAGFKRVRLVWLPILPARFPGLQRAVETRGAALLFRLVPPLGAFLSHSMVVIAERRDPHRV